MSETTVKSLYHCIPVSPEGDTIRPSPLYGTDLTPDLRSQFNAKVSGKLPLVYAAVQRSKAASFAFQRTIDEIFLNFSLEIEGSTQEVAFICNSEETMTRERDAAIYSFPADKFVKLDRQQYISDQHVKFSECKTDFVIKDAKDIMRAGVQVFSRKETFQELKATGFVDDVYCIMYIKDSLSIMGQLVKQGIVTWENKKHGINIDHALAKEMNIKVRDKKPQPRFTY